MGFVPVVFFPRLPRINATYGYTIRLSISLEGSTLHIPINTNIHAKRITMIMTYAWRITGSCTRVQRQVQKTLTREYAGM